MYAGGGGGGVCVKGISLPNSWILEEELMLGPGEELHQLILTPAPPAGKITGIVTARYSDKVTCSSRLHFTSVAYFLISAPPWPFYKLKIIFYYTFSLSVEKT